MTDVDLIGKKLARIESLVADLRRLARLSASRKTSAKSVSSSTR